MPRTHIRFINLRKWFPPHDPLAAIMARLSILREDYMLEIRGLVIEDIPSLDKHSDNWRKLYFIRNTIRTLMEINSALRALEANAEFVSILGRRPIDEQKEFHALLTLFKNDHQFLKDLRNSVGGHVQQTDIETTLNNLTFDEIGLFEYGETVQEVHFKFAGELAVLTMVGPVLPSKRLDKLEDIVKRLAEMLSASLVIMRALQMYAQERHLR